MDWSFDEIALHKAADHPVLSKEEERELLVKALREGDDAAAQRLVEHNVRLVIRRVQRFVEAKDARYHDMISAGFVGLMKALRDFDLDRVVKGTKSHVKFSTYAVWWIDAEVRREYRNLSAKPIRHRSLVTDYQTKAYRMLKTNGYYPDEEEIFEELGWDPDKIRKYRHARDSRLVTLDTEITEACGRLTQDTAQGVQLGPAPAMLDRVINQENRDLLNWALAQLKPEAEDIIRRHYGFGHENPTPYGELARFYRRTRERVRQIENEGLRELWVLLEDIDPNL